MVVTGVLNQVWTSHSVASVLHALIQLEQMCHISGPINCLSPHLLFHATKRSTGETPCLDRRKRNLFFQGGPVRRENPLREDNECETLCNPYQVLTQRKTLYSRI